MTPLEAALGAAVGHVGPPTDAELAAVAELTVVRPGDLGPLARCTGLRRLTLVGADVALPPLPGLEHLRLVGCRIRGPLAGARRDLLFSAAADLPANDDEVLRVAGAGLVAGVPHSRSVAGYRAELAADVSEYERRQCVRLWERTGAVFGAGLLVRPGPDFGAVRLSAADLERELDAPGFSLPSMFRRYAPGPAGLPALLALVADPPGARLRRWAAAAELWPDDRLGVERFAQRYPRARLRTDPRPVLDAVAAAYRGLVPAPFLLRPKLARWLLLRTAPGLCLGRLPGRTWRVGLAPAPPAPDDVLLALGYLVIGRAEGPEVLAVRTDDAGRIVALDPARVAAALAGRPSPFPAVRAGGEPPALGEPVYRSYRELLDDVTALGPAVAAAEPPRSTEDGFLPRPVRLELRRLGLVYKGRSTVDPAGLEELLSGVVSRPDGA
ncbi:hypothetical protein ACPPVO_30155 [Dactylosporangium sp. McL0621]|uniref:hypothetical protein n=1 Tax=Dactylosporangium sp. McL0621 TaxID=3415678 RepID=UPI003CFAFC15